MTPHDLKGFGKGGIIPVKRTAPHHGGIVSHNVGHQQAHRPGSPEPQTEQSTGHAAQVLAHGIHFGDSRTGVKQVQSDFLEVFT